MERPRAELRHTGPTRREVIGGAGAALAATLTLGSATPARAPAARVAGVVFDDREADGVRRAGSGLAGVMVSNGRDVTTTDTDGRWALPARSGEPVFVITPAGWSAPPGRSGIPGFWRAREHGEISFALRRAEAPTAFDVLLLADTQPSNAAELGYLRDGVIRAALDEKAAFAINHGDVVGDDLALYGRYLDLLGATGLAWHHCPGNHDRDHGAQGPDAFATWRRTFGPTHYAFEHGSTTFILLNNVETLPGGAYRGAFGRDQLAFVAAVLARTPRERLVIVSMHIPLVSFEAPGSPRDTTVDRTALMALLSDRPHAVSFAGHAHTSEHHYLGREHGFTRATPHHHQVLTAASGSWWGGAPDESGIPTSVSRDGSPKGFHVLSIDGVGCATRFVPVGMSRTARARLVLARGPATAGADATPLVCPVATDCLPEVSLIVDVFDGGPRTRLTFEIEGRSAPSPMQHVAMADPHVVASYARDRGTYRPWVAPALSSHVWTAPLPAGLAPGVHRLVVRGSDEFGRPLREHLLLEVTA